MKIISYKKWFFVVIIKKIDDFLWGLWMVSEWMTCSNFLSRVGSTSTNVPSEVTESVLLIFWSGRNSHR